jgi:hypothetical protein
MSTIVDTYLDEVLPSFFSKYNPPKNVISIVINGIMFNFWTAREKRKKRFNY